MASAVIHMVIANEINKVLKKDNDKILIGSIAPDIAKQIGENKVKSHFLDENNDIPNIDRFLTKYKNNINDDFVLGYFIHLYTDYLWFKYFIPEVYNDANNIITKMDGSTIKCNGRMLNMYIYNDYSNLNLKLLEKYDIDLSVFYKDTPHLENIIEEIPMDRIKIIVDKTALIIAKSKEHKDFLFNMTNIKNFINLSVELTMAKLKERNIT